MQVLSFSSPKLSTRNIVYLAMMMAMQIVFSRFQQSTMSIKDVAESVQHFLALRRTAPFELAT